MEGKVLKEFFQENRIDPYIAMIVESYIYKGKFIKDGKVAVIYSDSYGIGWWTQNYIDELAFDPKLVEIILHRQDFDLIITILISRPQFV